MDKKTYSIGILTVTAVMLLVANLLLSPPSATGDVAIATADMQAGTARAGGRGGDALYIYDVSSGKLAVFTAEPGKGLTLRAVEDLGTAFEGGNGGGGGRAAKDK